MDSPCTTTLDAGTAHRGRVPRARHVEMLAIAGFVIVASFLLDVHGGDRVHLKGYPSCALPGTCLSRELFHVDCPGCGLTRSFVYLAQFDWQSSWQMHRLGWLMFLAVLLQVPYRVQALLSAGGSVVPLRVANAFGSLLVASLIVNWLLGLLL